MRSIGISLEELIIRFSGVFDLEQVTVALSLQLPFFFILKIYILFL